MENAHYLFLFDERRFERSHGCGCSHAYRVPNNAPLAQKITGAQEGEHRLLAVRIYDGELGISRLNVLNIFAGVILGKEDLPFFKLNNLPRRPSVRQVSFNVEELRFFKLLGHRR